jgi:hypothetical protein
VYTKLIFRTFYLTLLFPSKMSLKRSYSDDDYDFSPFFPPSHSLFSSTHQSKKICLESSALPSLNNYRFKKFLINPQSPPLDLFHLQIKDKSTESKAPVLETPVLETPVLETPVLETPVLDNEEILLSDSDDEDDQVECILEQTEEITKEFLAYLAKTEQLEPIAKKEIKYPHMIKGEEVVVCLLQFAYEDKKIWLVHNITLSTPFCGMVSGNTWRAAEKCTDGLHKIMHKCNITRTLRTMHQIIKTTLFLSYLGVIKVCNLYERKKDKDYIAWVRSTILPLITLTGKK